MRAKSAAESLSRVEAVMACIPEVYRQRRALHEAYRRPVEVLLPECFDPGPYDADDAQPSRPATILGLPIRFTGAEIKVQ